MDRTSMITLVWLLVGSVYDLRTRTIPRWHLVTGSVLAALLLGAQVLGTSGIGSITGNLMAVIPGVLLLALSWIATEQIGAGDGFCVMIVGLLVGVPMIYLVLMAALLFSSACAAVILVSRRGGKGTRMPWIPFLAAGMVAAMVIRGGVG